MSAPCPALPQDHRWEFWGPVGKAISQELGDQCDGWDLPPLRSVELGTASAQFLQDARFFLSGSGWDPLEQTQAGESYIINKSATQNSLQPGKQGNRSNCGTFPLAAPHLPPTHMGLDPPRGATGQHPVSGKPSWRPHRGVFVRSGQRERC